jgi:hypothetical protein
MIRDPRVVFDECSACSRPARRRPNARSGWPRICSILDWLISSVARLQKTLGLEDLERFGDSEGAFELNAA